MEAGLTLRALWAAAGLNPGLSGRPHAARQVGQCGTASACGDAWNGRSHRVLVKGGLPECGLQTVNRTRRRGTTGHKGCATRGQFDADEGSHVQWLSHDHIIICYLKRKEVSL